MSELDLDYYPAQAHRFATTRDTRTVTSRDVAAGAGQAARFATTRATRAVEVSNVLAHINEVARKARADAMEALHLGHPEVAYAFLVAAVVEQMHLAEAIPYRRRHLTVVDGAR